MRNKISINVFIPVVVILVIIITLLAHNLHKANKVIDTYRNYYRESVKLIDDSTSTKGYYELKTEVEYIENK